MAATASVPKTAIAPVTSAFGASLGKNPDIDTAAFFDAAANHCALLKKGGVAMKSMVADFEGM